MIRATHLPLNIMSDAPSVHRVVRLSSHTETGRTPHMVGSSKLRPETQSAAHALAAAAAPASPPMRDSHRDMVSHCNAQPHQLRRLTRSMSTEEWGPTCQDAPRPSQPLHERLQPRHLDVLAPIAQEELAERAGNEGDRRHRPCLRALLRRCLDAEPSWNWPSQPEKRAWRAERWAAKSRRSREPRACFASKARNVTCFPKRTDHRERGATTE